MKNTLLLFAVLYSIGVFAQDPPLNKPNIILILGDDIGYSALTVNGGQSYQTPRLDSMARNGMNFKQCRSTPLCSTSRNTLLTGKYNLRNFNNFNYMTVTDKTIANVLRDNGYVTGIFGKHQSPYSVDTMYNWGWDYHCIMELTEHEMPMSRYKNPNVMENGVIHTGEEMKGKYSDDVFTSKIFDFISSDTTGKPFFVYYPMAIGHSPYSPTPDDPEFATWTTGKSNTAFFPSMIRYMDKKVGEILDWLQQHGLDSNTLVLYTGDNGIPADIYYNADGKTKIQGKKAWPIEGGVRVPLIAYWPNHVAAGSVNNNLVDFTDFFTTLAQAAQATDLSPYGILDGVSFYDGLLGKPYTARQQSFFHYNQQPAFNPSRRWVQDQVYKYYDLKDVLKPGKFYNIATDPDEKLPIANNKLTTAQKAIKQKYQALLDSMGVWPAAPVVQGASVSNITANSALVSANIISPGASDLIDRGSNIALPTQNEPHLDINRQRDTVVALGPVSILRKDLLPQIKYRYTLYAINNNTANSTGVAQDSFYTLSNPPLLQPPTFKGVPGSTTVNLSWTKAQFPVTGAKSGGYIIIYSADSIKIADTANGKAPDKIVIAGTLVKPASKVLPTNPATTIAISGLKSNTNYTFTLVPYTWDNVVAATYNYLISGARVISVKTTGTFASAEQVNNDYDVVVSKR